MSITTGAIEPTQIHNATAADVPRIATTLARAFFDDPVFRWISPDEDRRRTLLPGVFALFAETLQRHDETYVVEEVTGAALWAPPGQPAVPEDETDAFGAQLGALFGVDAERAFDLSTLLDEHHPSGSYWFLQFLGVEPEQQGRGLGIALLAAVLERCDRDGARAYLDATSPRNKRLYERLGFRAGEPFAPAGGPPLWPMWREPCAPATPRATRVARPRS